jgi:hypothetical protein
MREMTQALYALMNNKTIKKISHSEDLLSSFKICPLNLMSLHSLTMSIMDL